ncbi:MAG: hypothetical protein K8T90_07340 [Planctomycetes bacterium]|nr:hypothetical protein [Planctomycetota bacterium]
MTRAAREVMPGTARGDPHLTALDTSVIVAAILGWHESHARAITAVAHARSGRGELLVPVPALVQAFSVMTRLPPGHRVSAADARDHLRAAFRMRATLAAAGSAAAWRVLDEAVASGVHGGGIYDFEILDCAAVAGATRLLTLNPDDFVRFGDRGVAIVVP